MIKEKKSLFCFLVLSTLIFGFSSCADKAKKEPKETPDENSSIEVKPPANIISLELADSIYNNYSKHRVSIIESYEIKQRAPQEKFEASRFVDFDFDTIKQYIDYVEQEANKAGVKKITKLRLYFANYPNQKKFPNGKDVVQPRHNSIFMLPTLDRNGLDYGFFIGANGKPELISDWKASTKKDVGLFSQSSRKSYAGFSVNFSLNSSLQRGNSLTLNFGNGGPPPKTDF